MYNSKVFCSVPWASTNALNTSCSVLISRIFSALTPGLFGNHFGLTESSNYGNEQSGGGRNVLDGLSGFMGDGQWDSWDKTDSGGGGVTGMNGNSNNGVGSTTFYVNPNPSSNKYHYSIRVDKL